MAQVTRCLESHARSDIAEDELEAQSVFLHQMIDQQTRLERNFHKFEILDKVFGEFLISNIHQGRRFDMDDILDIKSGTKLYFRFEHESIPYLATVRRQELHAGPTIDIKLPNDGFLYKAKNGAQVRRHRSDGWLSLSSDKGLRYFDALLDKTSGRFVKAHAWYNHTMQRMDITFFPEQRYGLHLRVTYEPGSPYVDDEFPSERLPFAVWGGA